MYQYYQEQIREEVLINTSTINTVQKYRDLTYIDNFPNEELVETGLKINGIKVPIGAYFEAKYLSTSISEEFQQIEIYARMVEYLYNIILNNMKNKTNLEFIHINGNKLFEEKRKEVEELK